MALRPRERAYRLVHERDHQNLYDLPVERGRSAGGAGDRIGGAAGDLDGLVLFFARPARPEQEKVATRLRLGRWLSLALEFELAADILRTAIAPSWDEIGKLAAIVVLRTLLNYFLEREIRSSDAAANP
jgi:uncharacterized membrane protein